MDAFWQNCLSHLRSESGLNFDDAADRLICREWDPARRRLVVQTATTLTDTEQSMLAAAAAVANDGVPIDLEIQQLYANDGLIKHLTFDNYVCGHANHLALTAAEHVAVTTGSRYNPLCICGAVGLGKTHLMHAIGNRFSETHPKAKIHAASLVGLLHATAEGADFKNLDLALVDDIHLLLAYADDKAAVARAQDVMLSAKHLVVTSNAPIFELESVSESLFLKLASGMTVSIEKPESAMRSTILMAKAGAAGLTISEDVADFLAKRITGNIRELEGILMQLITYQQLEKAKTGTNTAVTLETAKSVLHELRLHGKSPITIDSIQQNVADYFGIAPSALTSGSRSAKLVQARQLAIYLAKTMTQLSFPEIARRFGGKANITVTAAVERVEEARNDSGTINRDIRILEQMIRG